MTAEQSLLEFLNGKEHIKGKTFVDIGSGSGLFSLAAFRLGAKRIVSVDVDEFSIACVNRLRRQANNPRRWQVRQGSILDQEFVRTLGVFDVVYSWGVLHHSGNMYQAIENILPLCRKTGELYIALYNDNRRVIEGTSVFWQRVKELYNQSPAYLKKVMYILYSGYYISGLVLHRQDPVKYIARYRSLRGMDFWTDIHDWLGGYPYEFATAEKVQSFFSDKGFQCEKCVLARSIGCNEFLFSRSRKKARSLN